MKDLAGAFAQLPRLPKMLKSQAIVETLVEGCVQGTFVLKLTRPDRTFRTWWRTRPDDAAMNDPAIELVLPEVAELGEIPGELLTPKVLPDLWVDDEITAQTVMDYFSGKTVVQVDKGGFKEPVPVPKASTEVINAAIADAVEAGKIWLLSGPASLLAEPIPAGVLTATSRLCVPPLPISAASILPENLPNAWKDGNTTALSIATVLSQQAGNTLPWKTVRDVIGGSLQARFIALADDSVPWPCELAVANAVKIKVAAAGAGGGDEGGACAEQMHICAAAADFEPSQIQDLGDIIPKLLEIKAKSKVAMKFHVRLDVGDGTTRPGEDIIGDINHLFEDLGNDFYVK